MSLSAVWTRIHRSARSHWLDTLVIIVLMGVAVARSLAYRGVVIDDAFITFRHAANLVHGHGFSCDPAQHVEGTSSPLFAMLTALPIAFGFEPYGFATWLATLAFAGCVAVAYLTVRTCLREPSGRLLGLGASALVATSSILAFHSQTGLETLLYAFFFAAALWQLLQCLLNGETSIKWAVLMGAAATTRPEGILLFAVLLGFAGFARRGKVGRLAILARESRAFACVWLPWLLFRVFYFHKWLPNSVLAKSGYHMGLQHAEVSGIVDRLIHGEGSAMLVQFASDHVLETALLLGAVVLRRVRWPILLAVIVTLAYGAMITWNGGDWIRAPAHGFHQLALSANSTRSDGQCAPTCAPRSCERGLATEVLPEDSSRRIAPLPQRRRRVNSAMNSMKRRLLRVVSRPQVRSQA